MPEPEFEVYLSLLSKLLHLTSGQRAEITAELRDHLEERLQELEAQGHERGRAIALALEEFGDAAALAHHITLPHLALRRRQLMRFSFGSIAVIAVTFVLAAFYWPAQRHEPSVQAIAQAPATDAAAVEAKPPEHNPPNKSAEELRRDVEEKLARRNPPVEFQDAPLQDALDFLSDTLDLDFVIDRKTLNDAGIDVSQQPVNLTLRRPSATVATVLDLVLRQVSLSYVIRDGIVLVTSPQETYEVQVYDCRDLLANVKVDSTGKTSTDMGGAMLPGGSGGGYQVGGDIPAGGGGMGGIGGGGGFGNYPGGSTSPAGNALINVVMAATGDRWLSNDGEGGTIAEFDGLLIVRHSQSAHRAIEDLLMKMREKKAKGSTANTVPKNGELLFFSAKWASPSQKMIPVIAKLEKDGVAVRTYDADRDREMVEKFGVKTVPTFIAVAYDREWARRSGACTESDLLNLLGMISNNPNPDPRASSVPALPSGLAEPPRGGSVPQNPPVPIPREDSFVPSLPTTNTPRDDSAPASTRKAAPKKAVGF